MKRNLGKWLIFIFTVLIAALFAFYFSMPVLKLSGDSSWALLMPKSEIKAFRKALLNERIRLSVDILSPENLTDEQIEKYFDCDFVVFSPVMTAYFAEKHEKPADGSVFVIGMGDRSIQSKFDVILESQKFKVADFPYVSGAIPLENSDLSSYQSMIFDNSDGYITDYRFSKVVPKSYLKGVVCPNLSESIIPYIREEKTDKIGVLYYGFRKAR